MKSFLFFMVSLFVIITIQAQTLVHEAYLNENGQVLVRDKALQQPLRETLEELPQLTGFPMSFTSNTTYKPMRGVVLADIDGLAGDEIILAHNDYVKVIKGDGTVLWTATLNGYAQYPASVADINNDGALEIVVANSFGNSRGAIDVFSSIGTALTGFPFIITKGPISCAPALADINNDGNVEIIFGTRGNTSISLNPATRVINHLGEEINGFPAFVYSAPAVTPSIADINADGNLEIITACTRGLYVFDNQGSVLDGYPILDLEENYSYSYQSPIVVDLDADGRYAIVGACNGNTQIHYVRDALTGEMKSGWPKPMSQWTYTAPTVVDLEGNGNFSIFMSLPVTENAPMFWKYNKDGNIASGFPITKSDGCEGFSSVADIDNDGQYELLFGSNVMSNETPSRGFIYAYKMDGTPVTSGFPLRPRGFTFTNGANIGDVVGDGQMYIVAISYDQTFNPADQVYINVYPLNVPLNEGSILCGTYKGSNARNGFIENTPNPTQSCELIFNMLDEYGDGWNGASINVFQNDILLANITLEDGASGSESVIIPEGTTRLDWVSGEYNAECGFEVTNLQGDNIFTLEVGSGMLAGTFITFEHQCAAIDKAIISGIVSDMATNLPIEGASVAFDGVLNPSTITDSDGFYSLETVVGELYDIQISKAGYNILLEDDFPATADETKNFVLTSPSLSVSPTQISVATEYGTDATATITITNNGTGPLTWNFDLEYEESTKSPYTVAYMVNQYVNANYPIPMLVPLNDPENAIALTDGSDAAFDMLSGGDFVNGDWLAIDPNMSYLFRIDPQTGIATPILQHNLLDVYGMCYNSNDNQLYVKTYTDFYTLDMTTGATQFVGSMNHQTTNFAITNDGRFIVVDVENDNILEVNPITGEETIVMPMGFNAHYLQDLAIDRETNTMYWAAYRLVSNDEMYGELYRLDLNNGTKELVGNLPSNMVAFAIPTQQRWLSMDVVGGNIEAGQSQTVNLTMDGNWATSGIFAATMTFHSQNPDVGTESVVIEFTINASCEPPTNLLATSSEENIEISLLWTASETAESYDIYRDDEKIANVATTEFIDQDVQPQYDYCYQVKSICSEETTSDFSNEACASTIDPAINEVDEAFQVFPNPANNVVTIKGENMSYCSIHNILGQLIDYIQLKGGSTVTFNTNHLEIGVYWLKIKTMDGKIISKRIVINH
ncbi:MAG: T9SS type A sorting domain-containing protein [Bacteroidales bacterium]|nr:T9SS type A sorting domain-containing protein [Bacteroidales bacterium]